MESGTAVIDGDGVVVDLAELDSTRSLAFLSETFALETRAESNQLQVAAHWADLHSGDALLSEVAALPGRERLRTLGGDGTPPVEELCVGEFAAVVGLTLHSGTKLITDALDLRHRFPQLWARICRYELKVWICRRIAGQTRHLTLEAARYVDAAVAPYVSSLPPGRLFALVEAKIIEADPDDAEARARLARADRFVRVGRTNDCGIKTLIARAEAGDVILFTALCDRIAQILGLKGDPSPLDVRRSKALRVIANPIQTIALLAEFEGREATAASASIADDQDQTRSAPSIGAAAEPGSDRRDVSPLATAGDHTTEVRPGPAIGVGACPAPDQLPDPAFNPDDEVVITETDLHPVDIAPRTPINYATELQELLDRYQITPRDLLPKTVVYLHLDRDTLINNSGVVRVEDVGPISAAQFAHWIRGKHLTVTPVIDPDNTPAIDSYQSSARIKDALRMIMPAEAFPYGTNTSRQVDHDHVIPYRPPPRGGPPGQTSTAGVSRRGRRSHRYKTHGGWQVRTPEVGTEIWRTPNGWYFLVNPAGTHPLGNGKYARTIWDTIINDFTATHYVDEDEQFDDAEAAG